MTHFHHFLYGASRCGKTTLAAQAAKRGMFTLAVTMEPGVTRQAFEDAGALEQLELFVPPSDKMLFVFLDYTEAYLDKFFNGLRPDLILIDNLSGIQSTIIGHVAEPAIDLDGWKIEAKPGMGILGNIPKSSDKDATNPELMAQAQYFNLGMRSERLLRTIDALPFNTIITTLEQYDFDEKSKKDSQGRSAKEAAGRPRRVKGWPATKGNITKGILPSCVSGAVLHLTRDDSKTPPIYRIHTRTHTDRDGVEWEAEPRGLGKLSPIIDWSSKDGAEILRLKKTP